MANSKAIFYYQYEDIAELTGQDLKAVYAQRMRGYLDPESLGSTILYVARHATPEFRKRIFDWMTSAAPPSKPAEDRKKKRRRGGPEPEKRQ